MKVAIRNVGNVAVLDVSGEVDLYSSTHLREALLNSMQTGGQTVLVNMTEVRYVDSSGIATLVEGLQLSRQTQSRFGLYGLRSNARSVLELARLHKVFSIYADEGEALEKIASAAPFSGL